MCRWGCPTIDTTFACKWCGTRFCRECLRGDFHGVMKDDPLMCLKCKQPNCQGKKVEFVPGAKKPTATDEKPSKSKKSGNKTKKSKKK